MQPASREWADGLDIDGQVARWELRPDGPASYGVRNRFYTVIDAAGLDEDRARAWVVVRVVHEATRALGSGQPADASTLTKYVALAKAVQD